MKKLKKLLVDWYLNEQRDLPWRRTKDPYSILVSEIMLQQTTVRVVIPYFENFLEEFPTYKALAKAPEEDVLARWSGLGYYSRARNLMKAAREIAKLGGFPRTYEQLLELPGIGPYTAAAVSSIAFGQEVAAIDGNVTRVISRLFDVADDVNSKAGKEAIAKHANSMISGQDPSLHNQAMMELGATICTPKSPTCLVCPVMNHCQSFKNRRVDLRPVKKTMRKQEPWLWEMYLISRRGKIALVKNGNGTPWLKNTWVLPGMARPLKSEATPQADFKHSITHHKIFVKIHKKAAYDFSQCEHLWVEPALITSLGVSSVVLKAIAHIQN